MVKINLNTKNISEENEMESLEEDNNITNTKLKRMRLARAGEVGRWFQTICWINIPVIGLLYLLVLLISKNTSKHRKNFILGYLLYKLLVWMLAILLIYCLYKMGIDFIDNMLDYVT